MSSADWQLAISWWLGLLVCGTAGWPVAMAVFKDWDSKGYVFGKVVGLCLISFGLWAGGTLKLIAFTPAAAWAIGLIVGFGAWAVGLKSGSVKIPDRGLLKKAAVEELVFLGLFLGWAFVRGHNPDIMDLEKFMDFGFVQAIYKSEFFPPEDMWFAGKPINYYYFGHLQTATLAKLSGVEPRVGFNLMLATLFAVCFSLAMAIAKRLLEGKGKLAATAGGIVTAYLVTLGGNLHTIYAFTKGYPFDKQDPPPFWEIWANPLDPWERKAGWQSYWYPNATRFIPYTIHEFPAYSFVVSDVHGHVLGIPLALLAIGLLVNLFWDRKSKTGGWLELGLLGATIGWMFTTNALDAPIYAGVLILLSLVFKSDWKRWQWEGGYWKKLAVAAVAAGAASWPFLSHFESFVSGVGVNCPPPFLAAKTDEKGVETAKKFGPIIFEGIDKCQKSPLWMMGVLWGWLAVGTLLAWAFGDKDKRKFVATIGLSGAGLILFAEFFYFKDIYPEHFRSNTMFKLGYQAFIMLSIIGGYGLAMAWQRKRVACLLVAPLLYLVAIYPFFAVKGYFGDISQERYKGLDGWAWLERKYPDDYKAIQWLKNLPGKPTILEAAGDSYTDFQRVSAMTGLPTVAGWMVHEWLWRGSPDPITKRAKEVAEVYEAKDPRAAARVLQKYGVRYVFVGELERQKYPNLQTKILEQIAVKEFESGQTAVYKYSPK